MDNVIYALSVLLTHMFLGLVLVGLIITFATDNQKWSFRFLMGFIISYGIEVIWEITTTGGWEALTQSYEWQILTQSDAEHDLLLGSGVPYAPAFCEFVILAIILIVVLIFSNQEK